MIYVTGAFAVVVLLYGYALSPQPDTMPAIAPVILWVNLMLASILALPSLYAQDVEEGLLEQWLLLPLPLELVVLAKWLGHWGAVMLPSLLLAPLLALFLHLPMAALLPLCMALALGSLSMMAIGSLGAALVLEQRLRNAVLMLLILPFYLPVMLFGIAISQLPDASFAWALLLGMALFLLPLSLWVSARLIRSNA